MNPIDWARQHEHDPNLAIRHNARQVLRDHYLPTTFIVFIFIVVPQLEVAHAA